MYHSWHKLHFYKKKSNIAKWFFDVFNAEMAQSLSSLQSFWSWLFHSTIIFGAKIEISGTKWVEKTPIYLVFSKNEACVNCGTLNATTLIWLLVVMNLVGVQSGKARFLEHLVTQKKER